ncbi:hypothetical protein GCM10018966_071110 [Streptomyces yanii]
MPQKQPPASSALSSTSLMVITLLSASVRAGSSLAYRPGNPTPFVTTLTGDGSHDGFATSQGGDKIRRGAEYPRGVCRAEHQGWTQVTDGDPDLAHLIGEPTIQEPDFRT